MNVLRCFGLSYLADDGDEVSNNQPQSSGGPSASSGQHPILSHHSSPQHRATQELKYSPQTNLLSFSPKDRHVPAVSDEKESDGRIHQPLVAPSQTAWRPHPLESFTGDNFCYFNAVVYLLLQYRTTMNVLAKALEEHQRQSKIDDRQQVAVLTADSEGTRQAVELLEDEEEAAVRGRSIAEIGTVSSSSSTCDVNNEALIHVSDDDESDQPVVVTPTKRADDDTDHLVVNLSTICTQDMSAHSDNNNRIMNTSSYPRSEGVAEIHVEEGLVKWDVPLVPLELSTLAVTQPLENSPHSPRRAVRANKGLQPAIASHLSSTRPSEDDGQANMHRQARDTRQNVAYSTALPPSRPLIDRGELLRRWGTIMEHYYREPDPSFPLLSKQQLPKSPPPLAPPVPMKELRSAVSSLSKAQYRWGRMSDAPEFYEFFLNALSEDLKGIVLTDKREDGHKEKHNEDEEANTTDEKKAAIAQKDSLAEEVSGPNENTTTNINIDSEQMEKDVYYEVLEQWRCENAGCAEVGRLKTSQRRDALFRLKVFSLRQLPVDPFVYTSFGKFARKVSGSAEELSERRACPCCGEGVTVGLSYPRLPTGFATIQLSWHQVPDVSTLRYLLLEVLEDFIYLDEFFASVLVGTSEGEGDADERLSSFDADHTDVNNLLPPRRHRHLTRISCGTSLPLEETDSTDDVHEVQQVHAQQRQGDDCARQMFGIDDEDEDDADDCEAIDAPNTGTSLFSGGGSAPRGRRIDSPEASRRRFPQTTMTMGTSNSGGAMSPTAKRGKGRGRGRRGRGGARGGGGRGRGKKDAAEQLADYVVPLRVTGSLCAVVCFRDKHYVGIVKSPDGMWYVGEDSKQPVAIGKAWIDVLAWMLHKRMAPLLLSYEVTEEKESANAEGCQGLPTKRPSGAEIDKVTRTFAMAAATQMLAANRSAFLTSQLLPSLPQPGGIHATASQALHGTQRQPLLSFSVRGSAASGQPTQSSSAPSEKRETLRNSINSNGTIYTMREENANNIICYNNRDIDPKVAEVCAALQWELGADSIALVSSTLVRCDGDVNRCFAFLLGDDRHSLKGNGYGSRAVASSGSGGYTNNVYANAVNRYGAAAASNTYASASLSGNGSSHVIRLLLSTAALAQQHGSVFSGCAPDARLPPSLLGDTSPKLVSPATTRAAAAGLRPKSDVSGHATRAIGRASHAQSLLGLQLWIHASLGGERRAIFKEAVTRHGGSVIEKLSKTLEWGTVRLIIKTQAMERIVAEALGETNYSASRVDSTKLTTRKPKERSVLPEVMESFGKFLNPNFFISDESFQHFVDEDGRSVALLLPVPKHLATALQAVTHNDLACAMRWLLEYRSCGEAARRRGAGAAVEAQSVRGGAKPPVEASQRLSLPSRMAQTTSKNNPAVDRGNGAGVSGKAQQEAATNATRGSHRREAEVEALSDDDEITFLMDSGGGSGADAAASLSPSDAVSVVLGNTGCEKSRDGSDVLTSLPEDELVSPGRSAGMASKVKKFVLSMASINGGKRRF